MYAMITIWSILKASKAIAESIITASVPSGKAVTRPMAALKAGPYGNSSVNFSISSPEPLVLLVSPSFEDDPPDGVRDFDLLMFSALVSAFASSVWFLGGLIGICPA